VTVRYAHHLTAVTMTPSVGGPIRRAPWWRTLITTRASTRRPTTRPRSTGATATAHLSGNGTGAGRRPYQALDLDPTSTHAGFSAHGAVVDSDGASGIGSAMVWVFVGDNILIPAPPSGRLKSGHGVEKRDHGKGGTFVLGTFRRATRRQRQRLSVWSTGANGSPQSKR